MIGILGRDRKQLYVVQISTQRLSTACARPAIQSSPRACNRPTRSEYADKYTHLHTLYLIIRVHAGGFTFETANSQSEACTGELSMQPAVVHISFSVFTL